MADKYITLHPNDNGVLDTSTNVYPNIKASKNILDDSGNPINIQEKLINGTTIKTIRVGSSSTTPENLLGSGSIVIDFLNKLYPIGTIYTCSTRATVTKDASDDPICPIQEILGGVWKPIYDTFLYASAKGTHVSGTNDYFPGDSGGAKDAVLVSHNHNGVTGFSGAHSHYTKETYKSQPSNYEEKTLQAKFGTRPTGSSNTPFFTDWSNTDTFSIAENIGTTAHRTESGSATGASDIVTLDFTHKHKTDVSEEHKHTIDTAGDTNGVGKNMPPYMAIYAWERIS